MVNPILGCFICDEKHCGHMTLPLNWHTFALPVRICPHNAGGATVQASLVWGHAQASLSSGWGPGTPHLTLTLYFVTCPVGCSRRSPLRSCAVRVVWKFPVSALLNVDPKDVVLAFPCRHQSLLCMGSPEVMSGCFKYPFFDDLADRNSVTTSYAMRFAVQSLLLLRRRKT